MKYILIIILSISNLNAEVEGITLPPPAKGCNGDIERPQAKCRTENYLPYNLSIIHARNIHERTLMIEFILNEIRNDQCIHQFLDTRLDDCIEQLEIIRNELGIKKYISSRKND